MRAEDDARVEQIVRRWPVSMPAMEAAELLGLSRNTFHRRVREGAVRFIQDGPMAKRRYSTDWILMMRGIERPQVRAQVRARAGAAGGAAGSGVPAGCGGKV